MERTVINCTTGKQERVKLTEVEELAVTNKTPVPDFVDARIAKLAEMKAAISAAKTTDEKLEKMNALLEEIT